MATAEQQVPIEVTEEEQQSLFMLEVQSEINEELAKAKASSEQVQQDYYLDGLLERLKDRQERIAENLEVAERKIEMIRQWAADVNRPLEREAQWLRLGIEAAASDYDFGPKKKSRSLPNGSFGYRSTQDKLEIIDMDQAVKFAELVGMEDDIKKTINKTPLKEYFKDTGVIPDGCEVIDGEDVFFVKAGL